MEWKSQFDGIELKVRQMGEALDSLRAENAQLRDENLRLKQELEKSAQAQPIAVQNLPPERKEELRKQIDRYIEEIERCIEWLNKA